MEIDNCIFKGLIKCIKIEQSHPVSSISTMTMDIVVPSVIICNVEFGPISFTVREQGCRVTIDNKYRKMKQSIDDSGLVEIQMKL